MRNILIDGLALEMNGVRVAYDETIDVPVEPPPEPPPPSTDYPSIRNGNQAHTGPTCRFGDYEYALVVEHVPLWVTINKHPIASPMDEDWTSFDLSTIAGNPLKLPLGSVTSTPGNALDGHFTLTLCVTVDGHIHIAGNGHADPMRYVRSTNPEDITAWASGKPLIDTTATGQDFHTYMMFVTLPDGTVLWFFDQQETFAATGRDVLLFRWAPGDTEWQPLGDNGEFFTVEGIGIDRAYINPPMCTADGRVHAWGWPRYENNTPASQLDAFYVYSDDAGDTWFAVDGTPQPLPITQANNDAAQITSITYPPDPDAVDGRQGIKVAGNIAVDGDGNPHMIMSLPNTTFGILHAYWDGSDWQSRTISPSGFIPAPFLAWTENRLVIYDVFQNLFRIRDAWTLELLWWFNWRDINGRRCPADAISLREDDTFRILIPDGELPRIYTWPVP